MSQSMSGWETELASGWIKFRSISSTVSLPTPTRTTAITTEDEPSLHYYSSSLTEFQRRKQANSSPFSTHQILFFPKLGIDILLHLLLFVFFPQIHGTSCMQSKAYLLRSSSASDRGGAGSSEGGAELRGGAEQRGREEETQDTRMNHHSKVHQHCAQLFRTWSTHTQKDVDKNCWYPSVKERKIHQTDYWIFTRENQTLLFNCGSNSGVGQLFDSSHRVVSQNTRLKTPKNGQQQNTGPFWRGTSAGQGLNPTGDFSAHNNNNNNNMYHHFCPGQLDYCCFFF